MNADEQRTPGDASTYRSLTTDELGMLASATRMRVLEEAGLLDDPLAMRALSLDRICELVIRSVNAPTAHVSIVTPTDQRYAGAVNVHDSIEETNTVSHDRSWCKFVAVDREPLVVEDATTHPMTAGSPAISDYGARSYVGVPLITEDGESLGAICAIDCEPHHWTERDIDTLKRLADWVVMEVELRRKVLELEQADRLKDDLVAMVTHELRNPLTTLVGSASLLDTAWEQLPDSKKRELVALMSRHGVRVNRLVDDLHTMARVDAGQLTLDIVDFELAPLVRRIVSDTVNPASAATVEVEQGLRVRADEGRVEQILANLLTNALKYGAPPVSITTHRVGDEVHMHVNDSGAGVPEDFVPRLFERFSRAPETAGAQPGSGLGLSIIRGYAQAMHGDVRFEPCEPGQSGACFVIVLPAA